MTQLYMNNTSKAKKKKTVFNRDSFKNKKTQKKRVSSSLSSDSSSSLSSDSSSSSSSSLPTRSETRSLEATPINAAEMELKIKKENFKTNREIKTRFINTFIPLYNELKTAIKINKGIPQAISNFEEKFGSNKTGINTLIPITNDYLPVKKVPTTVFAMKTAPDNPSIWNYMPLIIVIYKLVEKIDVRNEIMKQMITIFINKSGNINLQSIVGKESILTWAVQNENADLISFLIQNGANRLLLPENLNKKIDFILLKNEIVQKTKTRRNIRPPKLTPVKPRGIHKLNIPLESPVEYETDGEEPAFWKPLFQPNEMTDLKNILNYMMNHDNKTAPVNNKYKWSICDINQSLIPTYYVKSIIEPYLHYGVFTVDNPTDFTKYNIILCAALIVVGIISHKMKDQDYKLIIKGGKAVQLVLHNIPETEAYPSDDIDLLIVPKSIAYDGTIIKNLAAHIAYLVKWFLIDAEFKVSVEAPNPENIRSNPNIYKLSYVKDLPVSKYNRNTRRTEVKPDYKQFSDIDFKELSSEIAPFFQETIDYPFYIPDLDTKILFTCPTVDSILNEKRIVKQKYVDYLVKIRNGEQINENGRIVTGEDCERYIEKFERSIQAIEKAIRQRDL